MKKLFSFLLVLALMSCAFVVAEETASEISLGKTLKYGDTGDDVRAVQQRLTELQYYKGKISGNYLEGTHRAVEAFQKANGLEETGEVDSLTFAALFASEPASASEASSEPSSSSGTYQQPERSLKQGDTGEDVKQLQTRLTELNYYTGPVSGRYMKNTQKGVKAFQADNGLQQTGVADLETLALLFSASAQSAAEPTPQPEPYQTADPAAEEPEGITFQGIPWCSSPERAIQHLIDTGFVDEQIKETGAFKSALNSLYRPEAPFAESDIYFDDNSEFGYSVFCKFISSSNRSKVPDRPVSTKLRKLEILGKYILKTIAKQEIASLNLKFSVASGTVQLVEIAVKFKGVNNKVEKALDSALQATYGKPVIAKKAQAGFGAKAWPGDENTLVILDDNNVVFAKMNKLELAGDVEKEVTVTPEPTPEPEKEDTGF